MPSWSQRVLAARDEASGEAYEHKHRSMMALGRSKRYYTYMGGSLGYNRHTTCVLCAVLRPCGCPCGFLAAVRGARGRASTQAVLGSFSFARRRNIGRERRQKRLAILAKICYYEDRSLHAKRLFQWSLHPSRSPGTGTKLINLYKYYITKWCAYGLNAAVERRGSARQRQTIPT